MEDRRDTRQQKQPGTREMEKRTERRRDIGGRGKGTGVDNKLGSAVYARRVCIKSLQIRRTEPRAVRNAKESDDEINAEGAGTVRGEEAGGG